MNFTNAQDLTNRLKGRILLQIESNGEAWYVNPKNLKRYYLGRPADAFRIMRELGLGISENSYNSFNGYAAQRLAGKILLRVEANGEAYYVNPIDLKMHYLGRPADAFSVMRELGLGISNNDIGLIDVKEGYEVVEEVVCGSRTCKSGVCQTEYIANCCGNKICEVGETYTTCPVDCPNCDDANKCTIDNYDYHEQRCVNTPMLDVICCGNGACETGETYQNCARDCANCGDDNECTKDSYDYHEQKCINEVIIPCCGNGICDEGVEEYSICPADCPNCDDNNKLTADSFNYTAQKCENPITHYFIDDFEEGVQNWDFYGTEEEPTINWTTIVEDGNIVLKGINHNWTSYYEEWNNYILKCRFKRIKGSMHVNFRHDPFAEKGWDRYFVTLCEGQWIGLEKQLGHAESIQELKGTSLNFDGDWHTFEIRGYNNIFNVYIDNKLLIKYKDIKDPILSGRIGFETHDDSEFLIDDVEVKVINEEDVVYP